MRAARHHRRKRRLLSKREGDAGKAGSSAFLFLPLLVVFAFFLGQSFYDPLTFFLFRASDDLALSFSCLAAVATAVASPLRASAFGCCRCCLSMDGKARGDRGGGGSRNISWRSKEKGGDRLLVSGSRRCLVVRPR